jgi:hypothetical protein
MLEGLSTGHNFARQMKNYGARKDHNKKKKERKRFHILHLETPSSALNDDSCDAPRHRPCIDSMLEGLSTGHNFARQMKNYGARKDHKCSSS